MANYQRSLHTKITIHLFRQISDFQQKIRFLANNNYKVEIIKKILRTKKNEAGFRPCVLLSPFIAAPR